MSSLQKISDLQIPWCVKPAQFNDASMELHHFSDASHQAYRCCSYLRSINKNGHVHFALLLSKSRIAPTKSTTSPCLELQAAVLAAKVNDTVIRELDMKLCPSFFWTDSYIILKYIKNESRKFHVYVASYINSQRS